jgi:hypothetical protein
MTPPRVAPSSNVPPRFQAMCLPSQSPKLNPTRVPGRNRRRVLGNRSINRLATGTLPNWNDLPRLPEKKPFIQSKYCFQSGRSRPSRWRMASRKPAGTGIRLTESQGNAWIRRNKMVWKTNRVIKARIKRRRIYWAISHVTMKIRRMEKLIPSLLFLIFGDYRLV